MKKQVCIKRQFRICVRHNYPPKPGPQSRALCGAVCFTHKSLVRNPGPSVVLCALPTKAWSAIRALCGAVCALPTKAWSAIQGPLWCCVLYPPKLGPQSRHLCGTVHALPTKAWSAIQGPLWCCMCFTHQCLVCNLGPSVVLYVLYPPKPGPQSRALCGDVCVLPTNAWSAIQSPLWCCMCFTHQCLVHNLGPSVVLCVLYLPKPGPQSRALCGTVCALSIAIVLY